ncbi:MAG: hypothetical protein R3B84_17960 [Zavarzinella sp.]
MKTMFLRVDGVGVYTGQAEKDWLYFRLQCCALCFEKWQRIDRWRTRVTLGCVFSPILIVLAGAITYAITDNEVYFYVSLGALSFFSLIGIGVGMKVYFDAMEPKKTKELLGSKLSTYLKKTCEIQNWSNACFVKMKATLSEHARKQALDLPGYQEDEDDYYR